MCDVRYVCHEEPPLLAKIVQFGNDFREKSSQEEAPEKGRGKSPQVSFMSAARPFVGPLPNRAIFATKSLFA